jgi:hypothetical protein
MSTVDNPANPPRPGIAIIVYARAVPVIIQMPPLHRVASKVGIEAARRKRRRNSGR